MSIIRNTEGDNITNIDGSWTVFTDEFEGYAGQYSRFTAKDGTNFGIPQEDKNEETKYFKEGWWSSDAVGNNRITQAGIGQVVYFNVTTNHIPDTDPHTGQPSRISVQLYDDDGGLAGNPDPIGVREVIGKNPVTGSDIYGDLVTSKIVSGSKVSYSLTLSDGLASFIMEDYGDEIELYLECGYKEEQHVKLPLSPNLYLNVEICDKNVVQSFNNRQYGSCDFYRFRYDDFMRRHKHCGHMPPVYYFGEMRELSSWEIVDSLKEWWTPSLTEEMRQVSVSVEEVEKQGNKYKPIPSKSYGFKYCTRFSQVLMRKLSPLGKSWLDVARNDLQKYMEQGVIYKSYVATYDTILLDLLENNFNDNFETFNLATFSNEIDNQKVIEYYTDIEIDNDKFQEFAFATHPDAYDPKKMQELPLRDLIRVALTPDLKEWLGDGWWMTLKQAILVGSNYSMEEIRRVISEFDLEETNIFLNELWENLLN